MDIIPIIEIFFYLHNEVGCVYPESEKSSSREDQFLTYLSNLLYCIIESRTGNEGDRIIKLQIMKTNIEIIYNRLIFESKLKLQDTKSQELESMLVKIQDDSEKAIKHLKKAIIMIENTDLNSYNIIKILLYLDKVLQIEINFDKGIKTTKNVIDFLDELRKKITKFPDNYLSYKVQKTKILCNNIKTFIIILLSYYAGIKKAEATALKSVVEPTSVVQPAPVVQPEPAPEPAPEPTSNLENIKRYSSHEGVAF